MTSSRESPEQLYVSGLEFWTSDNSEVANLAPTNWFVQTTHDHFYQSFPDIPKPWRVHGNGQMFNDVLTQSAGKFIRSIHLCKQAATCDEGPSIVRIYVMTYHIYKSNDGKHKRMSADVINELQMDRCSYKWLSTDTPSSHLHLSISTSDPYEGRCSSY